MTAQDVTQPRGPEAKEMAELLREALHSIEAPADQIVHLGLH